VRLLVEIPSGCLLVLPQTPESFAFLSQAQLVEEFGYPKQIKPTKEGISIRIVQDEVIAPDSELNKALETIDALRSQLGKVKKADDEPL
jgi:hypothetical protein